MITETINQLIAHRNLSADEMENLIDEIMTGKLNTIELASLLTALACKQETFYEIAMAAKAMRKYARPFNVPQPVLEIVGTGGDHANTFNISTTTALIVAASGIPVAKHGNRAASSKSGSADVLEALNINIHLPTDASIAMLNMECEVFMGKEDTDRQKLNVYRMELLGAKVHPVTSGSMVLKDAINAALQEWASRVDDTFYVMGSATGPHPYPLMVRDFQSIISQESKKQMYELNNQLPDYVVACVGGGSNAIGSFANYIDDQDTNLIGVEAAGKGVDTSLTAATIERGSDGIFHGMKSIFLQNKTGQINPVYSISAGLDYPGVGPEHAFLAKSKRADYVGITDDEAIEAFEYIAKTEGIVAAIESCHAIAYVKKLAPTLDKTKTIICTLSGRGDKDVSAIAKYKGIDINE